MVVAVSTERYRAVCHPLIRRQAYYKYITILANENVQYKYLFKKTSILLGLDVKFTPLVFWVTFINNVNPFMSDQTLYRKMAS